MICQTRIAKKGALSERHHRTEDASDERWLDNMQHRQRDHVFVDWLVIKKSMFSNADGYRR